MAKRKRKGPRYTKSQKGIDGRVLDEAHMLVERDLTYQEIARRFSISPSTVHKDMTSRLPRLDKDLYTRVMTIASRHRTNSIGKAIQTRMTKSKYIKKNFDFSIFK